MALTSRLSQIRQDARNALDAGVADAAAAGLTRLQADTPVDTGDLRSTERIDGAAGSGKRVIRIGGTAGAATGEFVDYARYVNEDNPFVDRAVATIAPLLADAVATRLAGL